MLKLPWTALKGRPKVSSASLPGQGLAGHLQRVNYRPEEKFGRSQEGWRLSRPGQL